MRRVLVANRGEIAVRIIEICRRLGLETVAIHSTADAGSPHRFAADVAVQIGPPAPSASYLNAQAIRHVAAATRCDAVHPGYGFLSESAAFAAGCADDGLTFIGPKADTLKLVGDKSCARAMAARLGLPCVPGSDEALTDAARAAVAARDIGFPIMLKARSGGGGRGIRVVENADQFGAKFLEATMEAEASFADSAVYLERYYPRINHIEVQVLGDGKGAACHLFERDCSVQRRHQKVIEEAPSPVLDNGMREEICRAAVTFARGIAYLGAGTVEFIYSPQERRFYFIEMNARIQVEHPVTEMLFGVELLEEQIRLAMGHPLSIDSSGLQARGHVLEFRVNAEDPAKGFRPSPGRIIDWQIPKGPTIRFDGFPYAGFVVTPFYDSMLGKLLVMDASRAAALDKAAQVLAATRISGISSTVPFLRSLIHREEFRSGRIHTRWLDDLTLSAKSWQDSVI